MLPLPWVCSRAIARAELASAQLYEMVSDESGGKLWRAKRPEPWLVVGTPAAFARKWVVACLQRRCGKLARPRRRAQLRGRHRRKSAGRAAAELSLCAPHIARCWNVYGSRARAWWWCRNALTTIPTMRTMDATWSSEWSSRKCMCESDSTRLCVEASASLPDELVTVAAIVVEPRRRQNRSRAFAGLLACLLACWRRDRSTSTRYHRMRASHGLHRRRTGQEGR